MQPLKSLSASVDQRNINNEMKNVFIVYRLTKVPGLSLSIVPFPVDILLPYILIASALSSLAIGVSSRYISFGKWLITKCLIQQYKDMNEKFSKHKNINYVLSCGIMTCSYLKYKQLQ